MLLAGLHVFPLLYLSVSDYNINNITIHHKYTKNIYTLYKSKAEIKLKLLSFNLECLLKYLVQRNTVHNNKINDYLYTQNYAY